jgi:hypothetical protein
MAFTVFVLPLSLVYGQSYRDLGVPPSEIFQKMVAYVQGRDFEKLGKTLLVIKPLTGALGTKYSKNLHEEIQKAVDSKDGDKGLAAVQRVISGDLRALLEVGPGAAESPEKAGTRFKAAYLDYLVLSPFIQDKNFQADQKVRNLFRKASTTNPQLDGFKEIGGEIEKELLSTLPDLKH